MNCLNHKIKKIFSVFVFSCLLSTPATQTKLLEGNAGEDATESFTFAVRDYGFAFDGGRLYVGAHPNPTTDVETGEYALSSFDRGGEKFIPLTVEQAKVNYNDTDNPLYNQKISFLTMMGNYPVVVPENDQQTIYYFSRVLAEKNEETDEITKRTVLLSVTGLKDANGDPNPQITNLASGSSVIFAAVAPNGGSFGDDGSGIAVILYGKTKETIKDSKTGEDKEVTRDRLIYRGTTALDVNTPAVKIASTLNSLTVQDMHWDGEFKRLYVGLDVTSGLVAGGARAVVVGSLNANYVLSLSAITPDTVFVGDDEIVGTGTSASSVTIHKVRTMYTSTWLPYLIVLGGNASSGDTQRQVFAVPLVNNRSQMSKIGTLADVTQDPFNKFLTDDSGLTGLAGRFFNDAAQGNADIFIVNSEEAIVGAGETGADIVDMCVYRDAVYVLVDEGFNTGQVKQRILFSRPIFDEKGKNISWTGWRPVHATESKIIGFGFDSKDGSLMTIENENSGDAAAAQVVRRTQWGSGDETGLGDLVSVINARFPREDGGVHGWFGFFREEPALKDISLAITTGLKKVALVQTGGVVVEKGTFSNNLVSFDNGTIAQTPAATTRVLVVEGGQLDTVGPIEAAALGYESETKAGSTRLFVGGPGGLAALVNDDGSGVSGMLATGFDGIVVDMAFKTIGNYKFVRKLVNDGDFLYVLTDKKLDRIDLVGNDFTAVTLATVDQVTGEGGTFLDIVVSAKLCVLATSKGIYRTGNGRDVSTAASPADVGWTMVTVPDNDNKSVQKLIPISRFNKDLKEGGNLLVLSAHPGKNRATLNRFFVAGDLNDDIDANTVKPLEDFYTQKNGQSVFSYLLTYGTFRNIVSSDGFLHFSTQEKDFPNDPMFRILTSYVRPGRGAPMLIGEDAGASISCIRDIVQMGRATGAGNLFLASDSGLLVNE